jgi:hypothetical protein
MSSPNHSNDNPDVHLVESELRCGLENSRRILSQSRTLIELSECDSARLEDEGERAATS